MLVGIISDTHDNLVELKKALEIFREKKVEMLVHCGDWVSPFILEFFDEEMKGLDIPVKSVVGNNPGDIKRILLHNPKMKHPVEWAKRVTLETDLEGRKTVVYHGEDPVLLNGLIDSQKYDLVLTGHTHQPRNERIGKTLVINPGSTARICESKIISQASIAIYNTTSDIAEIVKF